MLASDKVVSGFVCILYKTHKGIKNPNTILMFVLLCEFTLQPKENKIFITEVAGDENLKRKHNAAIAVRLELNLSDMCAPMEVVEEEDVDELEYSNSSLQLNHGLNEA